MQREKIDGGISNGEKVCVIFAVDDDGNFTKEIHKTAVEGKTEQQLQDWFDSL